jgi:lipopolysaccharide/colanic/teichoic acid biosynthesis glycosyltransferase
MHSQVDGRALLAAAPAVIVLRPSGGDACDARLRFAAGEGWVCAPLLLLVAARLTLAPPGWRVAAPSGALHHYGCDGWERCLPSARDGLVVLNGRCRLDPSPDALRRALAVAGADVLALSVSPALLAYGEKLSVSSDGHVLGFRRCYRDSLSPGAVRSEWPHIAVLTPRAVAAIGSAGLVGSFDDAVAAAEGAGLRLSAFDVAGRVFDIASDEGLLACLDKCLPAVRAASGARGRFAGRVAACAGASVAAGATVIGPSYLAAGSAIGEGALVRRSIIGPGVSVPAGAVVTSRVALHPEDIAAAPAVAALRPYTDTRYRVWPLFSWPRLGKRVFDVVFSVIALLFMVTLFPLIALAIKLTSRGPVLYGHDRQGLHGRVFRCLKFRTMVEGAHAVQATLRAVNEVDGPQFKLVDDPRVTLVGAFLRTTNLDELPQFFNVLAGDMSVVGPRPSPDLENRLCPMWREARLSVRPGITGLWQVSRSRQKTSDFHEWILYDVEYVRRISPWLDMLVMARTAKVMGGAFARLFTARETVGEEAAS